MVIFAKTILSGRVDGWTVDAPSTINIVKKWKVFESLWKRKNIRNDYNKAFSQATVHKYLTKINSIVNG